MRAMSVSRSSPSQRRYGSLPTSADGEAMQAAIGGGEETFLRHVDYETAEAKRCAHWHFSKCLANESDLVEILARVSPCSLPFAPH
jgi:hypothetical protein